MLKRRRFFQRLKDRDQETLDGRLGMIARGFGISEFFPSDIHKIAVEFPAEREIELLREKRPSPHQDVFLFSGAPSEFEFRLSAYFKFKEPFIVRTTDVI